MPYYSILKGLYLWLTSICGNYATFTEYSVRCFQDYTIIFAV